MNRLRRLENGQVLALVTMSMVLLLGFLALAVDVGMLWSERRHMQTAADAAAVAAAVALREGLDVTTAGRSAATHNSFTNGSSTDGNLVTVTINNPPLSGAYAGNNSYVEAIVEQPQTTYFLRALGYNTVDVSTRAVSGTISGPACMYSLDPSANNAFVDSGGNSSITANCGLLVDSSSTSGLVDSGGATLTASSIGVVAPSEGQGPAGVTYNIAPFPDPLAGVSAPAVGACNPLTVAGNGYTANSNATISAGTYCGGITVNKPATLTLGAGTYVLLGGGLQVQGGAAITGTGVTFYNTQNATYQYKPIVISGGSTANLTAPDSGSLQGILFFQDRNLPANDTGPSGPQNTISGGSSGTMTGALYFPSTPLYFSGGSAGNAENAILVGDVINISGGTQLSSDYSTIGGSPIKSDALYE